MTESDELRAMRKQLQREELAMLVEIGQKVGRQGVAEATSGACVPPAAAVWAYGMYKSGKDLFEHPDPVLRRRHTEEMLLIALRIGMFMGEHKFKWEDFTPCGEDHTK